MAKYIERFMAEITNIFIFLSYRLLKKFQALAKKLLDDIGATVRIDLEASDGSFVSSIRNLGSLNPLYRGNVNILG